MDNLFVYGLLKKGFRGDYLLNREDVRFITKGQTYELFCMFDMGEFPMVTEYELTNIKGELYRVPDSNEFWESLDDFEGDDYKRIVTPIQMEGSGIVKAQMYVAIEEIEDGMMIRDGIWVNKT